MSIPFKYNILQHLGESMHSEVFKIHEIDKPDHFQVLRKIKSRFISASTSNYIQHQIDQFTRLEIPQKTIPSIKQFDNEHLLLVQDYFTDYSLTHWLQQHTNPKLEQILTLSIAMAQSLDMLHKAGYIHKGLKPNNILINLDSLDIQLIDPVRILDINQLSHFIYDPQFCHHSLPYLSPEQTEKIKYSVNYDTDLYALGIIIYELLTGKPPFHSEDPVTILHSHLAECPQRIESIKPELPSILSDIVEQLLQKAPEKRYQTAVGLQADLMHCLSQWTQHQAITTFYLKRHDFSHHITIPSLMVGRETEKQQMLQEYEKAASGVFRSALISGYSGIGKTRLIQELQLPIVNNHGYFCAGKFDQFKNHIPYSTLIQAFTHLIKTYLTEDSERQQYWRTLIQDNLGKNARLITDLIPELELIIGKPDKIPTLPPVEAFNRFNDTMGLFIACLAKKQHPLTLFIDDLQWCDSASFDVLEYLFSNTFDHPYLFWIGAYRHNEVDNNHRLTRLIQKSQQLACPLLQIRLDALVLNDVNEMTAYILNTDPDKTQALATVIFQTSTGNPLFVNESLRWLHRYKHLHLNNEGVWSWDDDQLRHTNIPVSAVDLFKDKITKLPAALQKILGVAAILGTRFTAEDLALVLKISLSELYQVLTEAFAQNILVHDNQQLLFFHDQVQAAAERLVDDKDKPLIHYQIATAMINTLPAQCVYEELDNLFAIVEHLNAAGTLNSYEKQVCFQEARFYYAAGVASLRSLAIESANYYFHLVKNTLTDNDWNNHYDFVFSLYKNLARSEMALGHQDAAECILELLIQHANNDLDKADCLYEQTLSLSSLGQFKVSIATGNRGLDYFNRRIPEDDAQATAKVKQLFKKIHQNNRDVWQDILDMLPNTDRALLIEIGICGDLISDYYLSGMVPQLYLAAIQAIENALLGGIDNSLSLSFSVVAMYLQNKGQFDLSLKYENLALTFIERYPNTFGATRGMNGLLWLNSHNRETVETLIERCEHNIDRGKRCGDLYHTGNAHGPYLWYLILRGADMQNISDIATKCIQLSDKYNLSLARGLGKSTLMGWSALMQGEAQKFNPNKIAKILTQWEDDRHLVSIGAYYITAAMAHYYLGQYSLSTENLEQAQPYLVGLTDNILNRLWYVFRYLNGLQLKKTGDTEADILRECLQQVKTWTEFGPILKPYLALMIAEHACHHDNFSQARRYYLDAIDICHQQNYHFLQAFIQQQLGQLYLNKTHRDANMQLQQALLGYQRCGADVKAQQIMAEYSLVFTQKKSDNYASLELQQLQDVHYLLEASRNISQELDFNQLLSTIMKAIMERLGVQTGFLLIAENDHLNVFAKAEKAEELTILLTSQDLITTDTLSQAIVNYVFRTQEQVVLDNACQDGHFITDHIIIKQQLKSILCLPLLKQQQVLGVLYLENHLVSAVFSAEQIEQTQLLTAQAAIALHNTLLMQEMRANHTEIAQLNKTLEQRVIARTQELNDVNEELKDFAYVVSHDLKAPLRAINQLSGWIENDYADAFDDDGREQMSLLRNRAKRMHSMIDGILQYSRIGRTKIAYESIDVKLLFADIINIVDPPKHIKIDIPAQLPIVTADKIRLFQVLQNLLDNAIKYNNKKRGHISFNCEARAHDWCFTLQDNGMGIAEEHQHTVFQLFKTLATKDNNDSTGIGLSLIEKSINHWGGTITLQSTLDKGCQFTFTLPKERV